MGCLSSNSNIRSKLMDAEAVHGGVAVSDMRLDAASI
jgi:hypothetical protein